MVIGSDTHHQHPPRLSGNARTKGEINSLEPVREPARGYILTGAEPTRQVVVATTATQLQWALVRIDVYLEHQPGVVPKSTRQTEIDFDFDIVRKPSVRTQIIQSRADLFDRVGAQSPGLEQWAQLTLESIGRTGGRVQLGNELERGAHLVGGVGPLRVGQESLDDLARLAGTTFDGQARPAQEVGGNRRRLFWRQAREGRWHGFGCPPVGAPSTAAKQIHHPRDRRLWIDPAAGDGLHLVEYQPLRVVAHPQLGKQL